MKPQKKDRIHGITQKDIADALGIAQSTVATALNPKTEHKLLFETAEKIKAYAKEMGYRPQRVAQIMRGEKTRVIGVVVRMGIYSANHELVRQLANCLNRECYRLVMVDTQWFDGDAELVKNYLVDQAVEGVILCNVNAFEDAKAIADLLPKFLPIVSLSSGVLPQAPVIRVNTHGLYHQLARYHLALGSRNLVYLSMYRDPGMLYKANWSTRERVTGFIQAISEAGGVVVMDELAQEALDIHSCLSAVPKGHKGIVGRVVHPLKKKNVNNAFENGYDQAMQLSWRGRERCESLICINDDVALGAMAACADMGISVPEELRISGHDDTPAGRFGMVPLTTVRRPLAEMAEKAVEVLLHCLQNPDDSSPPAVHLLPADVLVRTSTAHPEEHQELFETGFPGANHHGMSFEFHSGGDRKMKFGLSDITTPIL